MHKFFFVILASLLAFSSCRFIEGQRIRGDGNVVSRQRSVTGFTGAETRGSIDIEVSQGDYKVIVEADQNIIPYIVTEVKNGNLVVHFSDEYNGYNVTRAKVYITAPALHVFHASGSGNISGKGKLTDNNKMDIDVGGSGNIDLEVNSPVVDVELSGSGNITLRGEAKDFSTQTNGSGNIEAYELKAETVKSAIHGSGNTNVSASVELKAEIYGSGNVSYKGSPRVSSDAHGSGSVSSAN